MYDVDSLFTIQLDHNEKQDTSLSDKLKSYFDEFPRIVLDKHYSYDSKVDVAGEIRDVPDYFKSYVGKIESLMDTLRKTPNKTDEDFNKLKDLDALYTELLETVGTMYKNKYIQVFIDVVRAQKNLIDGMTPIGFKRFKGIVKDSTDGPASVFQVLAALLFNTKNKEGEFDDYVSNETVERFKESGRNIFTPTGQQIVHENTAKGASLTGVFANSAKGLAMILHDQAEQVADGNTYKLRIGDVSYNGFSRNERGTKNNIFHTLSTLINAAIDNVKEEILYFMSVNQKNSNQFVASIGMGIPLNDVVKIFKHPVIEELGTFRSFELTGGAIQLKSIDKKIRLSSYGATKSPAPLDLKAVETSIREGSDLSEEQLDSLLTFYNVATKLGDKLSDAVTALGILSDPPTDAVSLNKVLSKWSEIATVSLKDEPTSEERSPLTNPKILDLQAQLTKSSEDLRLARELVLVQGDNAEPSLTEEVLRLSDEVDRIKEELKIELKELRRVSSAASDAEGATAIANALARKGPKGVKYEAAKEWPFKDNCLANIPHIRRILSVLIRAQSLLESVIWTSRREFDYVAERLFKDLELFAPQKGETKEEIKAEFFKFLTSNLDMQIGNSNLSTRIDAPEDVDVLKFHSDNKREIKQLEKKLKVSEMTSEEREALQEKIDKLSLGSEGYRSPQSKWTQDFETEFDELKEKQKDNLFLRATEFNAKQGIVLASDKSSNPVFLFQVRESLELLPKAFQFKLFKYCILLDGVGFTKTTLANVFPENFYEGFSTAFEGRMNSLLPRSYDEVGFGRMNVLYDLFKYQYLRSNYSKLGFTPWFRQVQNVYNDSEGKHYDRVYSGKTDKYFADSKKAFGAVKYDKELDRTYVLEIPVTSTPYYEFDYSVLDEGFSFSRAIGDGGYPLFYSPKLAGNTLESSYPLEIGTLVEVGRKWEVHPTERTTARVISVTEKVEKRNPKTKQKKSK